ncbi:hypothetical protein C7Y72_07820 [Paraconexibacter algicola]|uniref:Uncharacterized protein n=1 Tax=Paraconexibacter algicola TaxID=2133960 RepID=A0A2T4UK04_9ACTN|nr:hypothetical protein C7Y72_07820 [Paraconexibacter algicola]
MILAQQPVALLLKGSASTPSPPSHRTYATRLGITWTTPPTAPRRVSFHTAALREGRRQPAETAVEVRPLSRYDALIA